MNVLSNTPASYLPSRKSQLASQSRIARINNLYDRKQRQHRDSVVSNNSTSVLSEDNCVPIDAPNYRMNGKHNDEPSSIIKHEKLSNEFLMNEQREQRSPLPKDDEDDDYEAELKFTPRLKSRGSLLTMRKKSSQDSPPSSEKASPVENVPKYETPQPRTRRRSRVTSLRKTLGDPVPLPYLPKGEVPTPKPRDLTPPGTATVDRKRQIMESKWRKLVSQDKAAVEMRLKEIHVSPFGTHSSIRPDSPTLVAGPATTLPQKSLEDLQKEVAINRQKLDEIIGLLNQKQKFAFPFESFHLKLEESTFWTICIIILALCNIYVYYYL